ncbi:MAG: bi-domain-containing oxidoreductase [Gammaproteobacteria bacterium]
MPRVEDFLRRLYLRLPEERRPPLKRAWWYTRVRAEALLRRRAVIAAERVTFLDFEIAHLEPFEFVGPGPGEVLVEARRTVISPGTERNILVGLPGTRRRFPFQPGYSGMGVVRAVGRGVSGFAPGDRVAGGLPHASAANVDAGRLVKVPERVADESAAFVGLALIALLGIRKAAIQPGERVAVVGQGILGQLSNRLARFMTPERIVAVGNGRSRSGPSLAPGGADEFVALSDGGGRHADIGADVVVEVAGTATSMLTALQCAAPGGRVIVVGSTRSLDRAWVELARRNGVRIIGAHVSLVPFVDASPGRWTVSQENRLIMELMQDERLPIADLVTARHRPADCNAVFDRLVHAGDGNLGIVLDWQGGASPLDIRAARTAPAPVSIEVSNMQPLRIAIVGAGAIGVVNANAAAATPQAKVAGVFDVNARVAHEVAARVSAPVYGSYEAVLRDPAVEAVLLSVPHHLHRETAVAAAAAGKHVMLEKPIANTMEEADAIVLACRAHGVALTLNFSFRYLPRIRAARDLVAAGAVGDITGIDLAAHSYREFGYWYGARSNSPDDWRTVREKAGAGYLFMNLCHVIDYVYFITGLTAARVYGEYATLGSPTEVEDIVSISCRMSNGAVGNVTGSTIRRGGNQAEDRIWGTHGSIRIDGANVHVYSTRVIDGRAPGRWHHLPDGGSVNWTSEWIADFASAIRGGRPPPITARDGWDNLAFITTVLQSMQDQRALAVPVYPHGD